MLQSSGAVLPFEIPKTEQCAARVTRKTPAFLCLMRYSGPLPTESDVHEHTRLRRLDRGLLVSSLVSGNFMGSEPRTVLLIEDNPTDVTLIADMFSGSAPEDFRLTHRSRLDTALDYLSESRVDVILLDLHLPDANGLGALQSVRSAAPSVPILVLTGGRDQGTAAEALRLGAQDYLVKGSMQEQTLFRALHYAMERHRFVAETDLIRKRQLQLRDEFFSHVSHELRSPLTAIYEFASILADGIAGECSSTQHGYLNIILRNVGQLESMIGDLLEVTRAETGKLTIEPQRTSLAAIAQDAADTVGAAAAAKQIELGSAHQPNLPHVYADPVRLRQVFLNLLNNAIKFTPEGGAVTIRTGTYPFDPSRLLASVADTGPGIPPDAAEHIFERLYQRNNGGEAGRKGLGLGLYICKELVHRQGGKIWVESEPGKGSTFCFTVSIFSLGGIIAPILTKDRCHEPIALICVSLARHAGWRSHEAKAAVVRDALYLLRRCVLPDLDILLPQIESADGIERFFIVATAEAAGIEILMKRIRGQIERSPELRAVNLTWEVSWKRLTVPEGLFQLPETEFANAVADLIGKQVDTYALLGRKDEQKKDSYR